jgi:hypothetical protein
VAREWPRWYAANRRAIGADPGLLRPGQRLHSPSRPDHADPDHADPEHADHHDEESP